MKFFLSTVILGVLFLSLNVFSGTYKYQLYDKNHELSYVVTFKEVNGTKELHYIFSKPSKALITITDTSNKSKKYGCEALTVVDEIFTRINNITCTGNGERFVLEAQNIVDYNRDDLSIKYKGRWYYVW